MEKLKKYKIEKIEKEKNEKNEKIDKLDLKYFHKPTNSFDIVRPSSIENTPQQKLHKKKIKTILATLPKSLDKLVKK